MLRLSGFRMDAGTHIPPCDHFAPPPTAVCVQAALVRSLKEDQGLTNQV